MTSTLSFGCRKNGAGIAIILATVTLVSCRRTQEAGRNREDRKTSPPLGTGKSDVQTLRCSFGPGALPAETLPAGAPHGERIPINHFVILLQENRSFDHYFANLPAYGQPDVDVAGNMATNPDPREAYRGVRVFRLPHPCSDDLPHDAFRVREQFHNGRMDGFIAASHSLGREAMGSYDERTLPFYYALANTFAIGDRYFSAFLGPTWPNRLFFVSGTSFGHISNTHPEPQSEERSLFHQFEKANQSWVLYSDSVTFEEQMFPVLRAEKGHHFRRMKDFFADAKSGSLPALAWVESSYGGALASDEHPPADVQIGQKYVAEVVKAVFKSPNWKRSALILTFDEHGGFYDHVPPPAACAPSPELPTAKNGQIRFDQLGVRVPFIVVSPYAKAHYVSHRVYEHASVLRLIQARFDLPAMTYRDANATPPYDFFDFASPSFSEPPELPEATIDESELKYCEREFSGHKHREEIVLAPKPKY